MRNGKRPLALGIYVTSRGYAFALFEGPYRAIDWGTHEARGQDTDGRLAETLAELLDRYRPDDVVLEEWRVRHCRRSARIRVRIRSFERLAKRHGHNVVCHPQTSVEAYFAGLGAPSKHDRAIEIAARVSDLAFWAPPKRKMWDSVHSRAPIFDAAALNMTHFQVAE